VSSYGGIAFKVLAPDSSFPNVERDGDGFRRYRATVFLGSMSEMNDLLALESRATTLRAYGRLGGNIHLEAGPGAQSLSAPIATGSTMTRSAVLVSVTNIRGAGRVNHEFAADAEWVLV
jgi:hypothetical protein